MAQQAGASQRADVTEYGMRRALVVAGVMAASLMQTLDSTITNVALPTIQGNLGANQDEATWVVTSYIISAIIIIPITPWLQNRFGRRNYFVASVIGFTVASVSCGLSDSLSMLIISRVIQGAFGGGLLATAQAILRDTFPPEGLGASQGIFAMGIIIGPALGPPVGGILVDNYSWNWCFFINVAPGIFSSIILLALLRDPQKPFSGPIDVVGLSLLGVGLASLQYVLTEGEQNYWFANDAVLATAIVCTVTLTAFVAWQLRARFPVVDLHLLMQNRSVAAGSALGLAFGVAILGSTYVIPQFTQGPLGFTPTESGLLFLLRAAPVAVLTPFIARLTSRVDPRLFLGGGFICVAVGSWMQAVVSNTYTGFWTFAPALLIGGLGGSLMFVPLSVAVLGATSPREGPQAGAFINLAVQLGGSVSVALLDVVVDQRWMFHSSIYGANITLARPVIDRFLAHGTVAQLNFLVNQQAAISAYADATYAIAFVTAAFTPLILLMRKPRRQHGPVEAAGA